jgi:hypothetical protein
MKRTLKIAALLCLLAAIGIWAQAPTGAVVTYRAGAHGTLRVTVDGEEIASGDTVEYVDKAHSNIVGRQNP